MAANGSSGFHTIDGYELKMVDLERLATQWGIDVGEVRDRLTRFNAKGGVIPKSFRNRFNVLITPLWIDENGNQILIKPDENGAPKLNEEGRFEQWTYYGELLDLENAKRLRSDIAPLSLEDPEALDILMENERYYNSQFQHFVTDGSTYEDRLNATIQKKHREWQSGDYLDLTPDQKKVGYGWGKAIKNGAPRVAAQERAEQRERERIDRARIERARQQQEREQQARVAARDAKSEREKQRKLEAGFACAEDGLMGGPPCDERERSRSPERKPSNGSNRYGGSRTKRSRRTPKTMKKNRKSRRR
jgi:hypothetical protein